MRDILPEFYTPDESEYTEVWNDCTFVFDTSFLLDLYRYSKGAREDFFTVLSDQRIKPRLWLPYQVAYEFQRNRSRVIYDKLSDINKINNDLLTIILDVENNYNNIVNKQAKLKGFSRLHLDDVEKSLHDITKKFKSQIEQKVSEEKESFPKNHNNDFIREKIDSLFLGKIGFPFDQSELNNIYKEGNERYKNGVPPGFKDNAKSTEREQYGDLILWKEIIQQAQKHNKHIVFVTSDSTKGDWLTVIDKKVIGARHELLKEFKEETKKQLLIYTPKPFYGFIKRFLQQELNESTVEEISSNTQELNDETKAAYILSILSIRLKAFAQPASIIYDESADIVRFFFKNEYSFHAKQLSKKSNVQKLSSIILKNLGKFISIEIYLDNGEEIQRIGGKIYEESRVRASINEPAPISAFFDQSPPGSTLEEVTYDEESDITTFISSYFISTDL